MSDIGMSFRFLDAAGRLALMRRTLGGRFGRVKPKIHLLRRRGGIFLKISGCLLDSGGANARFASSPAIGLS